MASARRRFHCYRRTLTALLTCKASRFSLRSARPHSCSAHDRASGSPRTAISLIVGSSGTSAASSTAGSKPEAEPRHRRALRHQPPPPAAAVAAARHLRRGCGCSRDARSVTSRCSRRAAPTSTRRPAAVSARCARRAKCRARRSEAAASAAAAATAATAAAAVAAAAAAAAAAAPTLSARSQRVADESRLRVRPKAIACPGCHKALPRCAVCLQHLGCPDPTSSNGVAFGGQLLASGLPSKPRCTPSHAGATAAAKVAPAAAAPPASAAAVTPEGWELSSSAFSHWMVWCQSCCHGGHAAHLQEWFQAHDECPVSGCNCRCSLMDVPSRRTIVSACAIPSR